MTRFVRIHVPRVHVARVHVVWIHIIWIYVVWVHIFRIHVVRIVIIMVLMSTTMSTIASCGGRAGFCCRVNVTPLIDSGRCGIAPCLVTVGNCWYRECMTCYRKEDHNPEAAAEDPHSVLMDTLFCKREVVYVWIPNNQNRLVRTKKPSRMYA